MALSRDQVLARLAKGDGNHDLSGLDLAGADLSRLDLRGVNLSRADLSTADLRWAILDGADLHSSVLRRADCRWAILRGANLRQADLARANLGWADITGADLTGAQIEEANLDNVDLHDTVTERGAWRGAMAVPVLPAGLTIPSVTGATAAAAAIGLALLVHIWGWLWKGAYFGAFKVDNLAPEVTAFLSSGNLRSGLTVLTLFAKTLIASPLIFLAVAVLAGVVLLIPALFVLFGDQVLRDLRRPELRTPVTVALFVVYFALFWLFWPVASRGLGWLVENALPGEAGLRAVFTLMSVGGLMVKLGFLVVAAALVYLAYLGWRLLSARVATSDLPPNWRLRYPRLNAAYMSSRRSRLFARNQPLNRQERRRGMWALAGFFLLLPTLLSQAGAVYAYDDMCDGGSLPRIQLYTNREPDDVPPDGSICARLLARTSDTYYVFFPSETKRYYLGDGEEPVEMPLVPTGDASGSDAPEATPTPEAQTTPSDESSAPVAPGEVVPLRKAHVVAVADADVEVAYRRTGPAPDCKTCHDGPSGLEQALIDPDEIQISGPVSAREGNLVTLDLPQEQLAAFQYDSDTTFLEEGRVVPPADVLTRGRVVRAFGILSDDGNTLLARRVVVTPATEEVPGANAQLVADYSNLPTISIVGTGWVPESEIAIGLGQPDASGAVAPQVPLTTVIPDEDGAFSSPVVFDYDLYPTGAQYLLVARDPAYNITETAPWIAQPPPSPTPTATAPPPPPEITTVTPEGPTPESQATNTPFPEPSGLPPGGGPGGFTSCEPDQYEPDSGRGLQQEIFVSFSADGSTQEHNFCPAGDKDLMFFRVKAGRWYRVFTDNLAPGVDTVLAVGDLSPSTPCQPAGCWSDDREALTYASEVIFQAVEDDVALITVDNFGTNYSTEATYQVGVQEFIPEATPTPSPPPSATPTRTPTAEPAFKDPGDSRRSNDSCATAFPIGFNPIFATIYRSQDVDYYITDPMSAGEYEIYMEPPHDRDYDVEILNAENPSRNLCGSTGIVLNSAGDQAEHARFGIAEGAQAVFVVYPATSADVDAVNPYVIQFSRVAAAPTATFTPSVTPTPEPTDTPTPSPTIAVPLPTP